MTQIEYEDLIRYSRNRMKAHLQYLNYKRLDAEDFVHEAILLGIKDSILLKKAIVRLVHVEKYKLIGTLQNTIQINELGSKICKVCNEEKPYTEFYPLFDKRYGMSYYEYQCKKCKNKKTLQNKNFRYNNDLEYREKEKKRVNDWYLKNRKKNANNTTIKKDSL
jgi:hypothetical protein